MNENLPTLVKNGSITIEEWHTRVDLAACYRLMAHFDMDDLIYNHISARVPGPDEHFLLNPFGLLYEEITASNLVKVDLDGNIISETDDKINPAGFVIHSCIHRERPNMHCVIHTHTPAGVGVSCQEEGLLPLSQTGLLYKDLIGYHEYEGLALNLDEQKRVWHSKENLMKRDRCFAMAKEKGFEPIEIALAYVLNQDFPVFPLIGPRNFIETESSVNSLKVQLTKEEMRWLDLN